MSTDTAREWRNLCEIPLLQQLLSFHQITKGQSIPITLIGQGMEPSVCFSFMEFDFGPRFLHNSNMLPNEKILIIKNVEKEIELR